MALPPPTLELPVIAGGGDASAGTDACAAGAAGESALTLTSGSPSELRCCGKGDRFI